MEKIWITENQIVHLRKPRDVEAVEYVRAPAPKAADDDTRLRKALSEAISILEGEGYLVQASEYKEILEDTE